MPGFTMRLGLSLVPSLVLLACATPATGVEAPAPDSAAIARLESYSKRGTTLQLVLADRELAVRSARFDSAGILLVPRHERAALLELGAPRARPAARRLSWSEVQSIRTVGSHGGEGFSIGFLVGAAGMATLVAVSDGGDLFERGDRGAFALGIGFTLVTTTVGFLVGLTVPSTKTVWP